jgi:hypothetical protein
MKLTNIFLFSLVLLNSSLLKAEDASTALDEIHDQNVRFGSFFSNKKDRYEFSSKPRNSSFGRENLLLKRDEDAEGLAGPVCRSTFSTPEPYDFLTRNIAPISFQMSKSACLSNKRINLAAGARFSYARCGEIYDCTTARIKHLKDEDQATANNILNEYAAKDFAKNFLKSNMESMEKLEILNNFAHKRFNSDSKACAPRFKAVESKTCNFEPLTKGFKRFQRKCNAPEVGCFKENDLYKIPAYLDFDKDFKAKNESSAQAYFNLRAEKISNYMVEKDKQYIEELGELISSEKFKEISSSEKEEIIIEVIKKNNDPVLSADFDKDSNSIKSSKEFDNLRKLFLKQNITKKDFASEFDKLRKDRADSKIKESCGDVPTLTNLCATVTSIRKGERSPVGIDNVTLSHFVNSDDSYGDSEELKKLKAIMGESWEDSDVELNLDAKRCYAFGYSDPNSENSRKKAEDQKKEEVSSEVGGTEVSNNTGYGSTKSGSKSEKEEIIAKGGEDAAEKEDSSKSIITPNYPAEEAFTNNMLNPNAYSSIPHVPPKDSGDEEQNKTTESTTRSDSEASAANDARIADLVKKLSATEDRLEKLKASTEAAEEARVKEKKVAEENALISELKGQINELKNKSQRPTEVQAPVARQELTQASPGQNSNYSFGSRSSSDTKNNVSDSGEVNRASKIDSSSNNAQSSQASSAGRSIASTGSQLSLVNSEGGNDQAGVLALTRVDGMSSEKALETISNRILELNGIPFLIEEDGITKKVIPLIRDGKIELDEKGMPKYVKIKVNSKTCSKADSEAGKCRAPAAVAKVNSSVADEKRDEEEKARKELARAQYIKLKALTNEALKSKKGH